MSLWTSESEGDTMIRKNGTKCMALVLLTGLLLCGCGDGREESVQTAPPHNAGQVEEEQYLELVVEDANSQGDRDGIPLWENNWNQRDDMRIYETTDKVPYMVKKSEAGTRERIWPWKKNWEKKFKKKPIEPEWYQLLDDQTLYIFVAEFSADPQNFYKKQEEYKEDYYTVHYYLMRINVTTGAMEEVPTPQVTYEEFYKKKGEALPAEANGKEIYWYDIRMLSNGNFVLTDYQTINRICNGITGEKMADLDFNASDDGLLSLAAGDDFVAAVTGTSNQNPHKFTLRLYDGNTGKEQYSIPLDLEESTDEYGDTYVNYCMSASEDKVALVYKQCIYTVEYGDDQVEKVVDAEKDKTYYLPDEEMRYNAIYIGTKDDFYVRMSKESSDQGQSEWICHYSMKGTEENEG